MMKASEKHFFQIEKIVLRFLGLWPSEEYTDNFWAVTHITINFIICFVAGLMEVAFGLLHLDDINLACDGLCSAGSVVVTALKILLLIINRKKIQKCLDELHKLYLNGMFDFSVILLKLNISPKLKL